MNAIYAIISVVIVSLISVIFAIPFLLKKKISNKTLLFLLSVSVGVLLATSFMEFLPESFAETHSHEEHHTHSYDNHSHSEHTNEEHHTHSYDNHSHSEHTHEEHHHRYTMNIAFYILAGFLIMFILEKFIHYHHSKKCEEGDCGHSHAYSLAPINLIGDGIHNFLDGLVIAGSYAVNITLGITATISIIFHEVPQEIADFGILLYSGMSKKRALIFNFLSALTAVVGTLIGLFLARELGGFTTFIIPFAAGNFIYIAASNLLPQLHRHCKLKDTLMHLFAISLGIAIIALVIAFGPGHVH